MKAREREGGGERENETFLLLPGSLSKCLLGPRLGQVEARSCPVSMTGTQIIGPPSAAFSGHINMEVDTMALDMGCGHCKRCLNLSLLPAQSYFLDKVLRTYFFCMWLCLNKKWLRGGSSLILVQWSRFAFPAITPAQVNSLNSFHIMNWSPLLLGEQTEMKGVSSARRNSEMRIYHLHNCSTTLKEIFILNAMCLLLPLCDNFCFWKIRLFFLSAREDFYFPISCCCSG